MAHDGERDRVKTDGEMRRQSPHLWAVVQSEVNQHCRRHNRGITGPGNRTGGSAAKESERCCGDVADANGQREPELQGSISDEQRRSGNGGTEMADASSIQDGGADSHGVLPPEFRGGKLNPRWVEWLMGVPIGWLALEPLGMASYRQWWQSFCGELAK